MRDEAVTGLSCEPHPDYVIFPLIERVQGRSVEENYDTNGVRNARFTNELESYKVSKTD